MFAGRRSFPRAPPGRKRTLGGLGSPRNLVTPLELGEGAEMKLRSSGSGTVSRGEVSDSESHCK